MKKNFLMWLLTFIVALIGFLIAIVSFFQNRRFFWRFKNEKDLIPKKKENGKPIALEKKHDCDSEPSSDCGHNVEEEIEKEEIEIVVHDRVLNDKNYGNEAE